MRGPVAPLVLLLAACGGGGDFTAPGSDLSHLPVVRISIGADELEVWVADTSASRERGLMFASADQLAPLPDGTERGMLFVWSNEQFLSFWMKNTFVPLDLAYVRDGGMIAEVHALTPHDTVPVGASVPARYALEVRSGALAALGIGPGDSVVIPPPFSD
jgi:uncharacterized membrane protein (UPF0127 family)